MSMSYGRYKIVQSKNKKGDPELCAVPAAWEKDRILYWPPKMSTTKLLKLLNNPGSVPDKDWTKIDCIPKRTDLASLDLANDEIDAMESQSDTAASDIDCNITMPAPKTTNFRSAKRVVATVSVNPDAERLNYNAVMFERQPKQLTTMPSSIPEPSKTVQVQEQPNIVHLQAQPSTARFIRHSQIFCSRRSWRSRDHNYHNRFLWLVIIIRSGHHRQVSH